MAVFRRAAIGFEARPRARRRIVTSSVAAGLVLLLSLLAVSVPPAHNWDMLAYAALALNEGDAQVRHERVWDYVRRDTSDASFARLAASDSSQFTGPRADDVVAYRRAAANNPAVFAEQLPFYAVKPMYPALIAAGTLLLDRVAIHLGMPADVGPVAVSILVAKFCWIGLGVALFLLLRLRFSNSIAAVATVAAMSLPTVHALGSYSTPDSLSGLLILFSFLLALRDPSRRWTIASTGVALLCVAARPDNLLLLGLLLTWFLWNGRIRFRWAVIAGMAGVLWCLLLSELSHNYGWPVLIYHSFIDYAEYPSQLEPQIGLSMVLNLYAEKFGESLLFFRFLGLGAFVLAARFFQRGMQDRLFQALLVMLLFMAEHWLLFPDQKDRLMVAPYLFILATSLFCIAEQYSYRRQAPAPDGEFAR